MALSILRNERGGGNMSAAQIGTLVGVTIAAAVLAVVSWGSATPLSFAMISSVLSLGAAAGGLAGGIYDYATAADQVNRAETIAGMQIQTSTYGQPMAQLFPPWRLAGNIIWCSFKFVHEHREVSEGGKGGGPQAVSITKTYSVHLYIALCDTLVTGPMGRIRRAWADGSLIYDGRTGSWPSNWRFYPGTGDQPVDPLVHGFAPFAPAAWVPAYIYTCYLAIEHYDMGPYPRVPNFTFEVYPTPGPGPAESDEGLPLASITQTLCTAAGVPAERLDLSAVPALRTRLGLLSVQPVRSILEQLTVAYRFALHESGMRLIGRPVGARDVVAQIPEGDLDATEQAEGTPTGLVISRERSRRLPTQLSITYIDPQRSFQQSTQQATIGTVETVETNRALSMSLAMNAEDAKALAQESLDRVWIERTGYQFTVGRRWAFLEPGDRVEVESRSYRHTILLTDVEYGRPGLVVCKGRADSAPVIHVQGAAPARGEWTDPVLVYVQQTRLRFLDLPALDSNDQAPRLHVAYGYPEEAEGHWPGATLHRSMDGGAAYTLEHLGTFLAIGGTALTVLPDAPAHLTDTTSTVEVHLEHGQVLPITAAALQAGGNLAMLGSELIQFRDAELIGESTYVLSHLWRGRRGTQWATGTHVAGETFTWLDPAVYRLEQALSERYVPRQWKAVTRGLSITSATAQTYALQSENLKPWPAASLRTEQAGDDWLLSWRGTARFTGAWIDGSEASPDPDFLTYRVVIYTDGTGATVARQVDVPDNGNWQSRQLYTYTETMQISDFGAAQAVLFAQVLQVGRTDVSRPAAA